MCVMHGGLPRLSRVVKVAATTVTLRRIDCILHLPCGYEGLLKLLNGTETPHRQLRYGIALFLG
jgi:hypothetical protein